MDEVWERAVETALDGQTDCSSARSLTLDGVVKCLHGRLPPPSLLEKFQALEHLSIANIGLSSLDKFPHLPNLQKLILSDNRIAGGLEFLVQAGLASLRDLDLSNNRIQFVEDLAPLSHLKLVSLDLYECPVTRVKDYRSRVFALIRSLKYLDKMDADDNERPESEDEEEEEEDDDDEDDPGSGEIDGGEDRAGRSTNGGRTDEGVVDADDDEESDADEEETAMNGSERPQQRHLTNGFRVAAAAALNGEDDEEDAEDEEEDDLGEEIDEDDGEDEDVIEVHEIEDSDEDEDGVEEDDDDDDDEDEDEEDVEDEEEAGEPASTGRLTSTEGEIDGHDQGEEDENGEIGEEDDQGIEEEGEYEEDDGEGEDEVRFLTFHPLFHLHPSSSLLSFFFYINAPISAIVNQLPFKYFMLAHTCFVIFVCYNYHSVENWLHFFKQSFFRNPDNFFFHVSLLKFYDLLANHIFSVTSVEFCSKILTSEL